MNSSVRLPVTGVVIALNEADRIGRCIASLLQVCTRVVVLDSGSSDDTAAVARAAGAEVLHQDWLGFAGQKNAAIAQARTDWVLLLDADEWFEPDALAQLDAFLRSARIAADAVHERLDLDGRRSDSLDVRFEHVPVRDLDEHYRKLARYAALWAEGRAALGKRAGFLDLYTHPLFYLLKNYLLRGGFLDGREGAVFHLAYAGYTHAKYARLWARSR